MNLDPSSTETVTGDELTILHKAMCDFVSEIRNLPQPEFEVIVKVLGVYSSYDVLDSAPRSRFSDLLRQASVVNCPRMLFLALTDFDAAKAVLDHLCDDNTPPDEVRYFFPALSVHDLANVAGLPRAGNAATPRPSTQSNP